MPAYSKVIGARSYDLENRRPDENTPVDDEGRGSHTSSTVAGISVEGASPVWPGPRHCSRWGSVIPACNLSSVLRRWV
ncbi:hypothetical protein NC653_023746 [Populus alba x Populus x berolinensis]|uniref:Uncharacterized protein n=1 Tax=Populus alba x Populus x berolinensis TaxID=444605 RepID=A0AAD6QBB5_9ROSI|nr:hypothetical protein NC653_023746 [Populus alba x Populus x berolinensis]